MTRRDSTLPPLYGGREQWALIQADSLQLLDALPASSVSSIVTDPPYGVSMASWDGGMLADGRGFQQFSTEWASAALRVLKPGGHLAAFCASRTTHRALVGIEEAGFEIREQLLWMYGSGTPKSRRIPPGLGTALRPAYEVILVARKPLDPSAPRMSDHLARHGTGALNIDARRLPRPEAPDREGMWPTNVILSHTDECNDTGCMPWCPLPMIDRAAIQQRYGARQPFSRVFYAAKTTRNEREAGLDALRAVNAPIFGTAPVKPRRNAHPTVKPSSVMAWVIGLVSPPGSLVLDPFAGSGSTGIGAMLAGREFLGIEREQEYIDIARTRLAHWAEVAQPWPTGQR